MPNPATLRYAFLADIHGNLPALEAVIDDARERNIHHFVCLGDIVGYGPQPVECLETLLEVRPSVCMGNHDAAACGVIDPQTFNAFACETAERARLELSEEQKAYLRDLPYILEGDGFACAHGTFFWPESFCYLDSKEDAARCFERYPDTPLLLVAHTHIPCVYEKCADGTIHKRPAQDFTLNPGSQVIVNIGTVGFPRSKSLDAAYCIYDAGMRHFSFHTVAYNLNRYSCAVAAGSYDVRKYWFLSKKAEYANMELAFRNPPVVPPPTLSEIAGFAPKKEEKPILLWVFLGVMIGALVAALLFLFTLTRPTTVSHTKSSTALRTISSLAAEESLATAENILPQLSAWSVSPAGPVMMTPRLNPPEMTYTSTVKEVVLTSPFRACTPGEYRIVFSMTSAEPLLCAVSLIYRKENFALKTVKLHEWKRPQDVSRKITIPDEAVEFSLEMTVTFTGAFTLSEPRLLSLSPMR